VSGFCVVIALYSHHQNLSFFWCSRYLSVSGAFVLAWYFTSNPPMVSLVYNAFESIVITLSILNLAFSLGPVLCIELLLLNRPDVPSAAQGHTKTFVLQNVRQVVRMPFSFIYTN